ncbi:MAG: UDP-N-acetylmuramoyl-L-alanine--D-glutamate ligase [Persephonella sp.]|nr:MAG: UDP-N-acetylmuramoyl-L-alanine--D-glutamate ligase [Persephonella sp.]RUM59169.1 MAG: UDP-N-acetylmuramoyl-L-alanine--D-glutamate ligase [Persephonella sp.]
MLLIYGKGITGQSTFKLANELRLNPVIVDDKDYKEELLNNVNEIVVSPGIPFFNKVFKDAKKRNIPIIGEIEFAYRYFKGDVIAITGTDGKSTTTKLIHTVLGEDTSQIGGNYGIPFSELVLKDSKKTAILELSSFQIYSTKNFKPNIAVFLNLSTDHLDWHKKFCHYKLSKYKLFRNMSQNDIAILNYDDINVRNVPTGAVKYFFSLEKLPDNLNGIYLRNNRLILKIFKKEVYFDVSDINLKGIHNIQNIMATVLVGYLKGIENTVIEDRIRKFKPLPYRMEVIGEINGITFINDAKSTTTQAVEKAITSYKDKNILLIVGGINKGGDFTRLKKFKNIRAVFIIGKDKEEIFNSLYGSYPLYKFETLEDAVKNAFSFASKGDIILFSPGCASFDMFKNYKDRGEKFNKIFEELKNA